MTPRADVLIVGGGVIGCALARELAGRSLSVTLIERADLGTEASAAAAGMLSPQAEADAPGPLLGPGLASRDLYPEWVRGLEAETGIDVEYRQTGVLRCALSEPEERRLSDCLAWQRRAGLPVDADPPAPLAEALASALSRRVRRMLFFPREAIVHCRRLMAALARSLTVRGVTVRTRTAALSFRIEGGVCRGVDTEAGPLEAGITVDAAGAWAGFDRAAPFVLPVRPVRGQIVALRSESLLPTVVQSEDVYVVPRADGSLIAGATVEEAGFRKEVTAEGVETLIAAARRLVPGLSEARFEDAWAGLRPGTPDGLPFLGDSAVARLHLAAGHFRSGILLAPWTARVMAEHLMGKNPEALHPFSIARLGDAL